MIYTFAEFELDTRSFELRRYLTGDVIGVEPQVFDVLRFLVEHAGRVVTKDELLDAVWGTGSSPSRPSPPASRTPAGRWATTGAPSR